VNKKIENRKAYHDYFLEDRYEAGIALLGCEVKSIREGRINLKDSFVRFLKGEAYLFNCHISPYSKIQGHVEIDPIRTRKLLLNRAELIQLETKLRPKGTTVVPTCMYFKKGKLKVEIALAKGKQEHDKRDSIRKKIHDKESQQAIKSYGRKNR